MAVKTVPRFLDSVLELSGLFSNSLGTEFRTK